MIFAKAGKRANAYRKIFSSMVQSKKKKKKDVLVNFKTSRKVH